MHAIGAAQMHLFLTKYWNVDLLSDVQLFAALFAAMVHDFYHPGTNNAHEIKVSSAKALEYSDDAPLEHHHLASAFKVLHRHNFLRPGMSREDYRTFRALTIEVTAAPQPVHRRRSLSTAALRGRV